MGINANLLKYTMERVEIFRNVLSKEECNEWISKAPEFTGSYDFSNRIVQISDCPIVNKIQDFLERKCNCKLNCSEAQIQLWPIGSYSELHIHDSNNREDTDYNSLLYLNDNFCDGEFITNDLIIKPETGMLTFFDGSSIYHGVNKVKKNHRYTLIFWWQNTFFYEKWD